MRETIPASLRGHVDLIGLVSEADKPRVYASGDVYCAPNTHGESFGIVLIESMATGTPVVASDLEAFRRVLEDGRAGVLVPVADPAALAVALAQLLGDPDRRKALAELPTTAGYGKTASTDDRKTRAAVVQPSTPRALSLTS